MLTLLHKIQYFIKADAVLSIAAAAAVITMFFVPPSAHYISYMNFRVLSLLFCLMVVVSGFQKTGVFLLVSEYLLKWVRTLRALTFILVMLSFFSSMLITNDVALITFVPFAILLLTMTNQSRQIVKVIVLQTIAANLGSMLTPIGNPQNLYLYSHYNIPILEFIKITLPYTVVSFLLLCLLIFTIKKLPLNFRQPDSSQGFRKSKRLLPLYTLQFLICILCVLRIFDYRAMLAAVLLTVFLFDIPILKRVDYTLLLTFVCFFIFVGNIESISYIKDHIAGLLIHRELPAAILMSQIISNVPAALLLSAFTGQYQALVLGTDIGGLGSLVASLASLISYKLYCRTTNAQKASFLRVFTLYNVLFLIVLCIFYLLIRYLF